MRQILFRGVPVKPVPPTKEDGFVYGFLVQKWDNEKGFETFIYTSGPENVGNVQEEVPVFSHTVGQYTGIDDNGGRKMFEGDIYEVCMKQGRKTYTLRYGGYNGWCFVRPGESFPLWFILDRDFPIRFVRTNDPGIGGIL